MSFLINPFGRVVAIDSQEEYDRFLATEGFSKPSPKQEEDYKKERYLIVENMRNPQVESDNPTDVYLNTVSQGKKDGYSNASAALLLELGKIGINISTVNKGQKIALLFHNPYSVLRLEAPFRIIFTMFESDKIPDDWHDYLEAADLVIVPSKWCQSVFEKSGFKPTVVPLGYDANLFQFKQRENKAKKHEPFTFLHYNAFNVRKGFLEVFKAFTEEFDTAEPVKMIFKTVQENPPPLIRKEMYPNIEIIKGQSSDGELLDICARSDCFVFPSRGEGFGLTPLEAMATGLPAIVPNAHGITEYFDKNYMYEVKVGGTCPAIYSRYKGIDVGKMVVCDIKDLRKQMRWVYEHQDEALAMGKKAAKYVQKWTYANTALALKEIIEEFAAKPVSERPLRNTLTLEVL
jgi:glycosyltransferase involved in cell wall biosynthesis